MAEPGASCGATYQGDGALERLLETAGARLTLAELRELVAGVVAAPEGPGPTAWTRLVAADADPALIAQLEAFKAEMAAALAAAENGVPLPRRLPTLRAECARRGLAGFIVPRADEHQGEYLPARAERLAWLTGFTGSAGLAVVLADKAAIFVDGRYTLQVSQEVDQQAFEPCHLTDHPPAKWVARNLGPGDKLGYDPWLHTQEDVERLRTACATAGGALVACPDNPLDAVWHDQPPAPISPVVAHELRFAGKSSADKRRDLGDALAKEQADAAVLTAPDSIAWLLNIRGGDVPHAPLPLSFAVLHRDGAVELFVDRRKLAPGLDGHLGNQVSIAPPKALAAALERLGRAGARVLADPATAAAWVFDRLEAAGATVVRGADPCALPKACKNAVELDGARAAHLRDGAAVTRFLAWLAREAARGGLSEIEAAEWLAAFRHENELFRGLSFPTISGAGPNGAIVHYRATAESDRRLEPGSLYLVDSGAQYLDGTTDVTRTVAVGEPTAEMRERFSRVLKGHIAIATARFPAGTSGAQLDTLARQGLWPAGLDYDHGTGHGVGSYLGVHEGPQRLSKVPNTVPLRVGMIVSNEPGYYKTGAYGIRIENLVTVIELPRPAGAERDLLGFETLTLAPIDRRLVAPDLLTVDETAWLDAYHERVRDRIAPLVDAQTAAWLDAATRPLNR
jgi:Xaa-Pro aminopeptidase